MKNQPYSPTRHAITFFVPRFLAFFALCGTFLIAKSFKSTSSQLPAVPVADSQRWLALKSHITEMVDNYDGNVGIYIKDLKSGQSYEYNADDTFVAASLIKLPIMLATFEAISEGKLSLSSQILLRQNVRRGGSGQLKWARTGARYTVSTLVYAMMTHSDNTACAMIIDRLGYDYLNECFSGFGLVKTRINPDGMSLANYLPASKDNYTTPREMGTLLEKLYRHEMFNDGLSDLMIEIMKGANSHNRLAQHLPPQWHLARKTGLLRKHCHDVGIVYTPQGDYIICVLTGHNKNYKKAKGFIASIGRTTYNWLTSS